MYGVAKRGNPGDFYGKCGRAFGLRSATGSLGLTSGDGSLESSPVRPGCYLSIYIYLTDFTDFKFPNTHTSLTDFTDLVGWVDLIRKDTTDGAKANNPGGEVVEAWADRTKAPSTK